jgi:hypothetical protein
VIPAYCMIVPRLISKQAAAAGGDYAD